MFFFIFHYNHCYSNSISYCALFLNYINAQFKAATIFYAFIQSKYYKIYTSVTFRILFSCSPLITTKTGKRALLPYWPSTPVQPSMSKPSRQARPTSITVSHPLYPRNGRLNKNLSISCPRTWIYSASLLSSGACSVLQVCITAGNFGVLTNVPHDWNSQSDISLHYRLVSPCLEGANWNRWRQLLLAASLMAANERRLCAVDPYAEQEHVMAQSDGENSSIYGVSPASVTSQQHPH